MLTTLDYCYAPGREPAVIAGIRQYLGRGRGGNSNPGPPVSPAPGAAIVRSLWP
jgi:hypothetical protein